MMFSQAAKSIVNSFGSRQIHIGEKNFKIALIIGGTEEIGQTVSQLLKRNNKLNTFALYNIVTISRPLSNYTHKCFDNQRFKLLPSRMLMTKKYYSTDINRPITAINNTKTDITLFNHQGNNERNQIQELVEALYHLPIAEEASTLESLLAPNKTISKAKRRMKSSSWEVAVAKENNRQSLPMSLLNGDRKLATGLMKRSKSTGIIANMEAHYKAIGKSASWVIPAALSTNKPKLLHEICIYGRRDISWFSVVAKNNAANTMNEHHQKQSNMICNKRNSRTKLENIKATLGNGNVESNSSNKLLSSKKEESKFFRPICANHEDGNLQTKKIANDISRQSSALNVANHGCEADMHSRNNKTTRDDILSIIERKDWIQRVYSNIKSTFRDLHVTIRSRSATTLDSYGFGNIFALNESIPAADVMSNSAVLFARKDSKSRIRRKIEEFCAARKNSLGKPSRDDICNKRERKSCKTAKKDICQKKEKCQKKIKPCQERKKPDCSKKKMWMFTKPRKAVGGQKKSDKDKEEIRDCRTTRKVESQAQSCTRRKDDDICKKTLDSHKAQPCTQPKDQDVSKPTFLAKDSCKDSSEPHKPDTCRTISDTREDQPCTKPKDKPCKFIFVTCEKCYTEKKSDFCAGSRENECRKSVHKEYDKSDKGLEDKKCLQTKDEDVLCKREVQKECQEAKKTICKEKKKEEREKQDCTKTKKDEPPKKKECPTVVKAPGCPEDDKKKRG